MEDENQNENQTPIDRHEGAAPENVVVDKIEPLGDAIETSADDLVSHDEDRPKADNKLRPDGAAPTGDTPAPTGAPNVSPPPTEGKKRGRKPMTDEEKAQAKAVREAIKAGKPAPDFSNLSKSKAIGQASAGMDRPPRDYYLEAQNVFIPLSMVAGKMLGEHWSIPIVEKEINGLKQKGLEPTEEQKVLLANMARWLEYEQFPEINARWGFMISLIAYTAPKLKTSPTPEKLKAGIEWFRVKILRKQPSLK